MEKRFRYLREKEKKLPRFLTLGLPVILLLGLFIPPAFAVFAADAEDGSASASAPITIHLIYHGKSSAVSSSGETVSHLLNRLELTLDEQDILSAAPDDAVYNGMTLSIDRILSEQQTYTVFVPRQVIRCNATDLPSGTQKILTPGSDGELLRVAEVTYVNGAEIKRDIIREDVLRAPVTAVIAQGAGSHAIENSAMPRIDDHTITLPTGEILTYTHTDTFRATAYTHTDEGCNMTTATGSTVHIGTVAVDPRYVPYGTRMFIMASDGSYIYGIAEAEDCGGDIIGDRMDLYMPTFEDCINFGRRVCTVYFLG